MVKSELLAALVADGLEPPIARATVDSLFETIAEHLQKGGRVELRGFGSFSIRSFDPRPRRNPATGGVNGIVLTRRVHFRPSSNLTVRLSLGARVAEMNQ